MLAVLHAGRRNMLTFLAFQTNKDELYVTYSVTVSRFIFGKLSSDWDRLFIFVHQFNTVLVVYIVYFLKH